MREAVAVLSRSGLLNANDTAVFETPARSATSAIVTRRATCSNPRLLGRNPAAPAIPGSPGPVGRGLRDVYHGVGKTGLANRFTDPNRDGRATSMVRIHNVPGHPFRGPGCHPRRRSHPHEVIA